VWLWADSPKAVPGPAADDFAIFWPDLSDLAVGGTIAVSSNELNCSPLMARILVVEDDPDIAELLIHFLKNAGHTTHRLSSGAEVMPHLRSAPADLVVLDVMLPGLDGMAVCDAMRRDTATSHLPIIMLTARGDEADRVAGLERGADDYVTKPFSPKELVARVAARLRRPPAPAADSPEALLQYGPITIDATRHTVTLSGAEVRLTAKEFLLLQYLVSHRGRVLSRDVLLTDVWGYQYTGGTRTVDVHIRRLREKLPVLNDGIETVKQFGYKLV
jgi:two-component system, OmpR family, alkaline phosphatase synthesis response regulator PhoP